MSADGPDTTCLYPGFLSSSALHRRNFAVLDHYTPRTRWREETSSFTARGERHAGEESLGNVVREEDVASTVRSPEGGSLALPEVRSQPLFCGNNTQTNLLSRFPRALRMVSTKPAPAQPKFRLFVRYTFKNQAASVSPRDIAAIEHLLRRGRRQLEMYEDPQVRDCFVSSDMLRWEEQDRGKREARK